MHTHELYVFVSYTRVLDACMCERTHTLGAHTHAAQIHTFGAHTHAAHTYICAHINAAHTYIFGAYTHAAHTYMHIVCCLSFFLSLSCCLSLSLFLSFVVALSLYSRSFCRARARVWTIGSPKALTTTYGARRAAPLCSTLGAAPGNIKGRSRHLKGRSGTHKETKRA
jgi:hypothetical protein